ncbi:hypothetical protein CURE108131_23155 [Cupriavidus respiraculi]|uniref:Uncharacterized protein n=1 Tax=Cupriavidus respiraculi TaxID=195930 RepID=A0ABN7YJ91_9BURK|nr:hypothetical protein [Cupriavidus respiraculi]CAG9172411.1 hypothetical protein LMG21510_01965 [Cupriavidus respiraculi]
MNIRIVWGFRDDADLLKSGNVQVKAGQVFKDVDPEYAHALIGKGLAEELKGRQPEAEKAEPKATKPAAAKETK